MVPATETLKTHCPNWKFADALALTLAWQLWPTLLCQLQDVHATENLKTHCPDGKIADVLLSDSRVHNSERFGQLYYSWYVPQIPILPIAPMGKLLTHLPQLTLPQLCGPLSGQLQWVRAAET